MHDDASDGSAETADRVDIALAVPLRGDRVFVARRPEGTRFAGSWEFPGGKVEPGESPATAAARELREETGLRGGELEPLAVLVHDYNELPLRFHVFLVREPAGEVRMDRTRQHDWKRFDELAALDMPEANRPIVRALRWRLDPTRRA